MGGHIDSMTTMELLQRLHYTRVFFFLQYLEWRGAIPILSVNFHYFYLEWNLQDLVSARQQALQPRTFPYLQWEHSQIVVANIEILQISPVSHLDA